MKIEKNCPQLGIELIFNGFELLRDDRFKVKGFSTLVKLDSDNHIIEAWQVSKDKAYHYTNGFISDPIEYELLAFDINEYLERK